MLDADYVYWVAPSRSVVKVGKGDDGFAQVLATADGPSELAVDDTSVYWIEFPDRVRKVDK